MSTWSINLTSQARTVKCSRGSSVRALLLSNGLSALARVWAGENPTSFHGLSNISRLPWIITIISKNHYSSG